MIVFSLSRVKGNTTARIRMKGGDELKRAQVALCYSSITTALFDKMTMPPALRLSGKKPLITKIYSQ